MGRYDDEDPSGGYSSLFDDYPVQVTPNRKEKPMAIKRETLAEQAFFANILLYGEPKSGKTTAAAAIARLGGPVIYVDAEAGLKKDPLMAHGIPVTNIVPFDEIEMLALDTLFWDLKDDVPFALVWDSVSESHKKLLEQTVARTSAKALAAGKERERFATEIGDYGINTQEMRHLTRQFRDLACHTIFVALEKRTQDEDTGTVKYGPDLTDKLASDLLGYVDVIGHCYTVPAKERGAEPEYWATFRNVGKYLGGDRFHMLPTELINPSADRIIGYLTGELDLDSDEEMAGREIKKATKSQPIDDAGKSDDEPDDNSPYVDGLRPVKKAAKKATTPVKKARPPKKAGK